MALSAKLELRQGQQLVMTPQLQQAIRLLQLSNIELVEFVDSELERNPLLEREEDTQPAREPAAAESEGATEDEAWLDLGKGGGEAEANLDTDYDNVFPDAAPSDKAADLATLPTDSGWAGTRVQNGSFDGDEGDLESLATSELSLREHLAGQLPLVVDSPVERLVGQHLIDLVDDAGYISADLAGLSEKLGAPLSLIEGVLAKLQTFDPPGVMARSLAECLALQLMEQNRYDPQIAALLDNLNLLASHNLTALKRVVGCDGEELADMIDEIKHLNPKPGLKFGSVQVQALIPDIFVRAAADGSWIVELNSDTLPRVLVNRSYLSKVNGSGSSGRDKEYLLECLQTANWLVKSLDQRARTILKVAEEIVRQQDGFFTHGVEHLRPLNLKTVAEAISMHESTISRVTSNKYMATPRGIFELKYFFTSAIQSAGDGEAFSSEAVRHRIKQLIDAESADAILSDDTIVEKLRSGGVDIARRTVAKYREALRIPSSVQRRREKKLAERILR